MRPDERADEVAIALLTLQIDRGRGAFLAPMDFLQINRLAQMGAVSAYHQNNLAVVLEGEGRHRGEIRDEADTADGGGGQNGPAVGLIVKRDIARHDRKGKRTACFANAAHSHDEL